MDVKKIGTFLAQLRREQNFTQEELGLKLSVTNKTVSRWENGNYLPPVEMLREISKLYGVSINELLSGERLSDSEYREKAEENITAVMEKASFTLRDRMLAFGQWVRYHCIWLLACLFLIWLLFELFNYTYGGILKIAVILLLFCLNHILAHVSGKAYDVTGDRKEFRAMQKLGRFYAVAQWVVIYLAIDALLHTLFLSLPAAEYKVDFHYYSIFANMILGDGASDPYRSFALLSRTLWDLLHIGLLNLDFVRLLRKQKS